MITREEFNKYLSQYYEIEHITSTSDMQNIRELVDIKFLNVSIANDTEEFIDINYKNILVTFKAVKGVSSSYDAYGGKAILTDTFEAYSDDGIPIGMFNIDGKSEDIID